MCRLPGVEAPPTRLLQLMDPGEVRLTANRLPPRPRFLCVWTRGLPGVDYRIHENSANNALTALMERVYWVVGPGGDYVRPPRVTRDLKSSFADFRAKLCHRTGVVAPLNYDQFVDHYRGSKRDLYQRASNEAQSKPYSHVESILGTFQKAERFRYDLKPGATPRLIQPRKPVYNIRVGRFLKPMEHPIYRAINKVFGRKSVAKGLNATQCADMIYKAWACYKRPVAHSFDCSHCEQHFRPEMLRWEHSVYACLCPPEHRRELTTLLRDQVQNTGFIRLPGTTIKFKTDGNRASGDMNTASGNVMCICAMIYSCLGKDGYHLIDNGDDFLIITEYDSEIDVQRLVPYFLSCGFSLRVEGSTETIEEIRFCQAAPLDLGHCKRMVRPPHTLTKDMASYRDLRCIKLRKAWLSAVGACGRALTEGVPVHYSVFSAIPHYGVTNSNLSLDAGFFQLSKGLNDESASRGGVISDVARVSYWKAFGISPGQQIELEKLQQPDYLDDSEVRVTTLEWVGLLRQNGGTF
jgi:hypothetical protein